MDFWWGPLAEDENESLIPSILSWLKFERDPFVALPSSSSIPLLSVEVGLLPAVPLSIFPCPIHFSHLPLSEFPHLIVNFPVKFHRLDWLIELLSNSTLSHLNFDIRFKIPDPNSIYEAHKLKLAEEGTMTKGNYPLCKRFIVFLQVQIPIFLWACAKYIYIYIYIYI